MSALDALYMRSPVAVQNGMVAAYGWWWRRRRFGLDFERLVAELREHEKWSPAQYLAYQSRRLSVVLDAARRAPHYRELLDGIAPDGIGDPFATLARMPLLSKESLRQDPRALLTGPPPRQTLTFNSSGTSGTPTTIYYTRSFHAVEVASIEARNLNWAGLTYRDRRVMFGARKICRFDQQDPPFWRFSPTENLAYASVYHLSPQHLPAYVAFLRSFKPAVVMGYPSALYALARYALDAGERVPPARGVFTSAESLHEYMRDAIQEAFGAAVLDRYGAVEGCVCASQCSHGRYHVSPEVGILEILDTELQPVPPGVEGEIVCTTLHNTLQPLIRYRIGDRARWAADQRCPCGRSMPIIEGIDGRVEDECVTRDGRRIVRFDTVFKGVDHIRQAQVIQEALDRFTIAAVVAAGFNDHDAAQLKKNMRLHVGEVDVEVRHVAAIPLTASGKFRAVISRLSPEEKRRASGRKGVAADPFIVETPVIR
jgi:phenylacetate-CoA ligase